MLTRRHSDHEIQITWIVATIQGEIRKKASQKDSINYASSDQHKKWAEIINCRLFGAPHKDKANGFGVGTGLMAKQLID